MPRSMSEPAQSPRGAFLKSPHHAYLAACTLGAGFVTGEPLYLLLGATAYVLGWIYLPDFSFFRKWMEKRHSAAQQTAAAEEVTAFVQRRDALISSLHPKLREEYYRLAQVCRDIEVATGESDLTGEARLRKIDELMWMFLRLLTIQQSLETFLQTERSEPLPDALAEAEQEVGELNAEIEQLRQTGTVPDARERLLHSREERLEVLRKRLQRVEETEANLAVVLAEQERLSEQIKLIRADAVATKNSAALSARINASVAQLDETNKWLSELDQFRDLASDQPLPAARVGFQPQLAGQAPPAKERIRPRERA